MKFKSKKTAMIGTALVLLLTFSAGVSAASSLERIQANLNHGISFLLNGKAWTAKDANGAKAVPISYKGTTYVPLRAVAEATGANIRYDAAKQQISITTGPVAETPGKGERTPFSVNNVSHFKWSYYPSGITRNKEDLQFGETQYETAFMVTGVNSAGQGVAFKVKDGTQKVGVLVGFKTSETDKDYTGTYTISDKDGQAFATGKIESGTVVENVLVLPDQTTELYVKFKGPAGKDSTGYVIWDESWLEN
ncbi:stalk domain-containing protein [Paenibacillus lentus]|uniref:stalk domain-containing protein n=1 Tax=Paenibacillus lentus TaxID=1338368 RepID=UPI001FEAADBE|nr:stalk domain-containing protein [Paenibacillus lentus]